MWLYKWKVGLSPTKQFQILRTMWTSICCKWKQCALCEHNFFCTVLKFILTDFFISLTWELTYHSSLSVPSPKLSPHLQRKPNAYGIPIKNECWFLHTNIDSRATPTLAWKGETGNKKKKKILIKSEGSAQLI